MTNAAGKLCILCTQHLSMFVKPEKERKEQRDHGQHLITTRSTGEYCARKTITPQGSNERKLHPERQ